MIRRALVLTLVTLVVGGLPASPRWYAPAVLRPGAVNELYAWDEVPVVPFTVEVVRSGTEKPMIRVRGFAVDKPLPGSDPSGKAWKWSAALLSLDALDVPGPVTVRFVGADKAVLAEVSSVIEARNYPLESISLDKTMSELREKPDPRKDREWAAIWAVYQKFDPQFAWTGGRFGLPVAGAFPLSAHFGDTRKYLYSDGQISEDYHRGTDFAVPVGTPVLAPAPGVVVLVANRMLTGTSVVIEHAPGVYSVYFHLSRALVKTGGQVRTGDRIALSGATGLVTGPHLHWEVRVGGTPVDAFDLVSSGLLDTGAVGAVISSIERSIH